jgi:hypothetical protein
MAYDDEALIDYLISVGEAVEYGEPWTETTTHEWWRDASGDRHVRLVQTYHGGGNRGDDDEAEYAQRLFETGRAIKSAVALRDEYVRTLRPEITHVIDSSGRARRFRYYMPPPEGVNPDGSGQ